VGPCQGVRHLTLEIGDFKLFSAGAGQAMTSGKVVPSQTIIPGLGLDRPKEERRCGLRESQTDGPTVVVVGCQ
jgi:hypothetical protein